MNKTVLTSFTILCLLSTVLIVGLAFDLEVVKADPMTIYVDDDNTSGPWDGTQSHPYQNITSGLEHASTNDTVFVYNGTYYENVVVNKNNLTLVGENKDATIIDGNFTIPPFPPRLNPTLTIDADNVMVNGFTVQGGWVGVGMRPGANNTVTDNIITHNVRCGMNISAGNLIANNTITDHANTGILLIGDYNTVINNTMTHNSIGIEVFDASNNKIENNKLLHGETGIDIHDSYSWSGPVFRNNTISENLIVNYSTGISSLISCTAGNKIVGNEVVNSSVGMNIWGLGNYTINGNIVKNCTTGVLLGSEHNVLKNNSMINNEYNLRILTSYGVRSFNNDIDTSNLIDGNPVYYLINRSSMVIDPSTCGEVGYLGLINCSNIVVRNLSLRHNGEGILMSGGTNNTITGNTITENVFAVTLDGGNVGNNITDNRISGNGLGIKLLHSNNNMLVGNTITNNTYYNLHPPLRDELQFTFRSSPGIYLVASGNNMIADNLVENNEQGIYLVGSEQNTLRNNNMTGNKYNFGILYSYYLFDCMQDIDTSNTVDGRPVYYWMNQHDRQVPEDAGYVALVNSANITIKNLDLTNNAQGIFLMCSTDTLISKNEITNTEYAIYVMSEEIIHRSTNNIINSNVLTKNGAGIYSVGDYNQIGYNIIHHNGDGAGICSTGSSNKIHDNTVSNNSYGIFSDGSYNTIVRNAIINNTYLQNLIWTDGPYHSYSPGAGLIIEDSNSTIGGNTIANNDWGTYIGLTPAQPGGNRIYHNNFINNTHQLWIGSLNIWDNGYPSGGNYWSDYTGNDDYSGPDQDQLGSDGIGDTPYVIDANDQDNYPFMSMFSSFNTSLGDVYTICNSTISDFQCYYDSENQTTVIKFNVNGTEGIGFCRICIPHTIINETYTVLVDGHEPDYVNYALYDNGTHRWVYFTYHHSIHEVTIIPEFRSLVILPLLIIATLLLVIVYRRKHLSECKNPSYHEFNCKNRQNML